MEEIRFLVVLMMVLAAGIFILGVWRAYRYSITKKPGEMPKFLGQAVTVIGGVLATNLGVVLGVKIKEAQTMGADVTSVLFTVSTNTPSNIQIAAAYLYVIGMLFALWGWWKVKFSDKPGEVVAILPNLSQTLLGVIGAVLAIALSG